MKQTTILIAIMFFSIKIFAQIPVDIKDDKAKKKKPVYVKTIDFLNDPRNLRDDTVKYNHKYRYILKNINKFVYKEATAEQKGESLNTERPEIFKGIKIPGFTTLKMDGIGSSNTQESAVPGDKARFQDSITTLEKKIKDQISKCECLDLKDLINGIPSLKQAVDELKNNSMIYEEKVENFSSFAEINRNLEKLKIEIQVPWDIINTDKQELIKNKLGLLLNEKDSEKEIYKAFEIIQAEATNLLEDEISPTSKKLTKELNDIIKKLKECSIEKKDLLYCKDTCSKEFFGLRNAYLFYSDCIKKIEAFVVGINKNIEEARVALKEIENAFKDGKIDSVQNNYNLLVRENFELEIEPFKADKDIHEITFTAKAEGPLTFGKPAKRTIKINAITSGGWKIDYSTGVFYNWGSNKFLGPEYYFEERKSDTSKAVIEAQRTKKAMLSIGALMHIYPRIYSVIRPGFAFGVSTTLGFDVLNFHGGASLLIGKPGKPNRLIISFGLTLREANLLDSRFRLNEFRKDYGDAVPTSKNFPIFGKFVSLTYNLSGISK